MRFDSFSPFVKLLTAATVVVVLAVCAQGVMWLAGSDSSIVDARSRGLLIGLALASLLVLMALDRRPASDFGLFVGPIWKKVFYGSFALGFATLGGYLALGCACGVFTPRTADVTAARGLKAALAAMSSFPLAITEQIMFSGYLLSILRDRYRRETAVLVPAMLFALMTQVRDPGGLLAASGQQLVVGTFLAATLLGILRLRYGTILMPAGLLAGWIAVERVVDKLRLLGDGGESPLTQWMAPQGDPRRAPVMWLVLAAAITICWLILRIRGEGKIPAISPSVDTNFKRIFPLSNALMLAPLDVWLAQLWRAHFRVGLRYLPRLVVILVCSTLNTILTLPERLLLPWLLRRTQVRDPVFIVGVHRSGTTHLHNLLALDPQFRAPRLYQTMNPFGFLVSGWLLFPFLAAFLPWRRPMDGVRFHVFSPQEEEFAVTGSCGLSPMWGMTFPRHWPHYDRYISTDPWTDRRRARWKAVYMNFVRCLVFRSARRPLLKSPYNTARVGVLRELFPRARFIHIARHPHDVYRSNVHLARQGHVVFQLQDPPQTDNYEIRFLENYHTMEESWEREAATLPDRQRADLRFEDLVADPLAQIEALYRELGLTFGTAFRRRLEDYLATEARYRRNQHGPVTDFERHRINREMAPFMRRWGYADDGLTLERQRRQAA